MKITNSERYCGNPEAVIYGMSVESGLDDMHTGVMHIMILLHMILKTPWARLQGTERYPADSSKRKFLKEAIEVLYSHTARMAIAVENALGISADQMQADHDAGCEARFEGGCGLIASPRRLRQVIDRFLPMMEHMADYLGKEFYTPMFETFKAVDAEHGREAVEFVEAQTKEPWAQAIQEAVQFMDDDGCTLHEVMAPIVRLCDSVHEIMERALDAWLEDQEAKPLAPVAKFNVDEVTARMSDTIDFGKLFN